MQYWVDNLREPVLFDLAVQKSRESVPHTVFLEIGPKPTLKAHLPDIFPKVCKGVFYLVYHLLIPFIFTLPPIIFRSLSSH